MADISPGTSLLARLSVFFAASRDTIVAVIGYVFSFVAAGWDCFEHAIASTISSRYRFIEFTLVVPHLGSPFPSVVNRGIDEQLHEKRSEEASDHRCGDALHHVGPSPRGPHDRKESEKGAGHGHHLRSHTFYRAMVDRLAPLLASLPLPGRAHPVVGEIEIEQHEDAGLRIEAQQR